MPELEDIRYSRQECIIAVRDYYSFLTKLYLDESEVIEPPEGGWPTITTDTMRDLGKTDEVISLLRHLPYIRARNEAQGAAWCTFADWQDIGHDLSTGRAQAEAIRVCSEDPGYYEDVPAHVIGLTHGGRGNPIFFLDTELGIVYWFECPGEIRHNSSQEPVDDDPYDYAAENEAEWRAEGQAWPVAAFFQVLKDQFRELNFVPVNSREVKDVYATYGGSSAGMIPLLQDVYRQHGWPNLDEYRKQECLQAVQSTIDGLEDRDAESTEDD